MERGSLCPVLGTGTTTSMPQAGSPDMPWVPLIPTPFLGRSAPGWAPRPVLVPELQSPGAHTGAPGVAGHV